VLNIDDKNGENRGSWRGIIAGLDRAEMDEQVHPLRARSQY
jgi:hypothetical protein